MATINWLPPEIIQLIVEFVEHITIYERTTGLEFGANLPTGRKSGRRQRERRERNVLSAMEHEGAFRTMAEIRRSNNIGDPDDDMDADEAFLRESFLDMLGGVLGLGPAARAGGAGPVQPTRLAPPPAPAAPANPSVNTRQPASNLPATAAPGGASTLNPQAPVFEYSGATNLPGGFPQAATRSEVTNVTRSRDDIRDDTDEDDYESSAWNETDNDDDDDYHPDTDGSGNANESDSDESLASVDCTYQDGLPSDPLLPLLYISRPFLHAARKSLYRRVHISTPFQGRLLLDSIKEPKHAARIQDEDRAVRQHLEDETDAATSTNGLSSLIKQLLIQAGAGHGMGASGAKLYINLIEKCQNLEKLVLKPKLPESATKPLLKALHNLPKLKSLEICSSTSRVHPFMVTVPRIIELLHKCPELEDLEITHLKGASEGPLHEEEVMYGRQMRKEQTDLYMSDKHRDSDVEADSKRVGLKRLSLTDFDTTYSEMSFILEGSEETLRNLDVCNPPDYFTRYDFALMMLEYGHKLTTLSLSLPSTWEPFPPPIGTFKGNVPPKPKNYVVGDPSGEVLERIADYRYILDAILPYLPKLERLTWDGPQASSGIFAQLPPSLKTISWRHSPAVRPRTVAKWLNKTITRNIVETKADGTKVNKTVKSKFARGLTCVSVSHDDFNWTEDEIDTLEIALEKRGACLHLTPSPGEFLGGFPIPLGGMADL
ncbi:uncharacterized protein JCM15063_003801 [Sporobolomyces koalae]|uniref:uncharacterized protein n=1 Tax=Sporobolomyces koalae TaxID=500713 RepID=UPI0031735F4C